MITESCRWKHEN